MFTFTTAYLWCDSHFISISVCMVWEVRAGVQVFRRELHAHIYLDQVKVEFISCIQKKKVYISLSLSLSLSPPPLFHLHCHRDPPQWPSRQQQKYQPWPFVAHCAWTRKSIGMLWLRILQLGFLMLGIIACFGAIYLIIRLCLILSKIPITLWLVSHFFPLFIIS